MVNPAAIEKSRQGKRRALELLYATLVVDTPRQTTDGDLADLLGVPKQDLRNLRTDLMDVKCLQFKREPNGRAGWTNYWTLIEPVETARLRLSAKWDADDKVTAERVKNIPHGSPYSKTPRTNGATADHPVLPDVLVASTGPDAARPLSRLSPERKDEAAALVEAARQYGNIHKQVDDRLKELEALGVRVDRDKIAKSMTLPQDSRLAAVTQVLPYIDQLERTNSRLSAQVEDMRGKVEHLPETQRDIQRLRNQNERLIGEVQALRQQLEGRSERAPKDPTPATVAR